MANSETDIVNTALILLGERTILALTDDNDVARACNAIWDDVRKDVLGKHPWNGCVKFVRLTRLAEEPVEFYSYYYLYPSDCVRILNPKEVFGDRWEIIADEDEQQKMVATDMTDPIVRYIANIKNVHLYSAWLCLTLSKRMAAELAITITDDKAKADKFYQAYELQLVRSKMRDGQEQSPVVLESTALTTDVRLG